MTHIFLLTTPLVACSETSAQSITPEQQKNIQNNFAYSTFKECKSLGYRGAFCGCYADNVRDTSAKDIIIFNVLTKNNLPTDKTPAHLNALMAIDLCSRLHQK